MTDKHALNSSTGRALNRAYAPDVFEAFHDLAHAYGVPALAKRMAMKPGTLYNKAAGGEDAHNQPTLRDVVLATQITGDMRVLDALDETFGRAAFDASEHTGTSDEDLLHLVTRLAAENGEFHAEMSRALQDHRMTREAMRRVRGEAFDLVAALMTLVHRLEDYCDDAAD